MEFPLQITIRDFPQSNALEAYIRDKVEKLKQFCDRVVSCRIVVEQPQKNKHQGKLYKVRIDLAVPQDEIAINKIQDEDVYVAIRDAFNAARRKLQARLRRTRGEVKVHEMTIHGTIKRIFPEDECGFIESLDGREYYFHSNNVAYPNFDQLKVGTEVQFLETTAGDGLQANRISAGKHQPLQASG